MRAVVIGGSGQIGGWLMHWLAERGHEAVGTYASVPAPGLVPLDAAATGEARAWLKPHRPDVVFYPAGFTWVDGCERDPERARAANRDQPLAWARAAATLGARFVSFSTDYVFDGQAGPYEENAPTNPLSVYGRAKLEAEQALARELGEQQLTIRTSWVFGPERQGKNFAYQVLRALKQGQAVTCPADMESTPSYGPDVARAAVVLAEQRRTSPGPRSSTGLASRVPSPRVSISTPRESSPCPMPRCPNRHRDRCAAACSRPGSTRSCQAPSAP
jgi:dTDP-4-dehydrorhamnose reductase